MFNINVLFSLLVHESRSFPLRNTTIVIGSFISYLEICDSKLSALFSSENNSIFPRSQLKPLYFHLRYSNPDFLYMQSWVPCLFFSGGVTVGAVGRALASVSNSRISICLIWPYSILETWLQLKYYSRALSVNLLRVLTTEYIID